VTKVGFLTYAGKEFGSGHIVRSNALANRLRNLETFVELHVINDDDRKVPFDIFSACEIVIVDLPLALQFNEILPDIENRITVGLDWFGPILFDYNIVLFDYLYSAARIEVYRGLQFAIVRSEILERSKRVQRVKTLDYVLTFGRSVSANSGEEIHRRLTEKGLRGEIINPSFYARNSIFDSNSEVANKLFISTLLSAKTILTSGGVTLIESIFLGIEVISFPLNKQEERFVQYLMEIGCVKHVFAIDNLDEGAYSDIKGLIQGRKSKEFHRCVDGLGVDRIMCILLEIQKKFSNS